MTQPNTSKTSAKTTTASGQPVDVEAMKVRALQSWQQHIEAYETSERLGIGTWAGIPKGMDGWHFVLFEKQNAMHAETIRVMLQQGYQYAPDFVYYVGSSAGDRALVLCAPAEVRLARRDRTRKMKLARTRLIKDEFGGHATELQDMLGVRGDVVITNKPVQGQIPSPRE